MNILRIIVAFWMTWSAPAAAQAGEIEVAGLLRQMESANSGVDDYRLRVRSTLRRGQGEPEETVALDWFQRPDRFRMELVKPHPGLVLVYPHGPAKVRIRPGAFCGSSEYRWIPATPVWRWPRVRGWTRSTSNYLRQALGKKRTSTVKSSSRPRSMQNDRRAFPARGRWA